MKRIILALIFWIPVFLAFARTGMTYCQDPPSGYTVYYGLKMYNEGAYPTADSVNDNLVDIDAAIHNRDLRIDSLRTAFLKLHDLPLGTFNDTVWVLGTASLGAPVPFLFGTYQGYSMNFLTQGVKRIIIGGTGKITLGTTEGTGVEQLYAGGIQAKDSIKILGQYSGNLKIRQNSDEDWQIYNTSGTGVVVFGNTDAPTWVTVNAGGYQTQGTTGYLTSAFGSLTASGLFVAASSGGAVTTELKYTNITINGITYKILTAEP